MYKFRERDFSSGAVNHGGGTRETGGVNAPSMYVKKGHASDMKTTFVFNAKLISKKILETLRNEIFSREPQE